MTEIRSHAAEMQIGAFYRLLYRTWGQQHWWPAQSRFEVILGAFLTQNTSWTNVERALARLRSAGVLNLDGIRRTPQPELQQLVRPAGYFRQKAQRLQNFVAYLDQRYGGSLDRMFSQPTECLRTELLTLNGIGPETADSILLYAGGHEVFPVDAYTRRLLERHGLATAATSYEDIRQLFQRALAQPSHWATGPVATANKTHAPSRASRLKRSATAQVYNEMHGLIVTVGKNYCFKSSPACRECPLDRFPHAKVTAPASGQASRKRGI
jgi:endonuclease-3 related protein